MVVDDDKEFLEELRESLTLSGYDVLAISDPVLALSVALQVSPRLILLDLKMPTMSGFQLADEIRVLSRIERIPVMAMSAYYKEEYEPLLNMCGIRKCFKKPLDPAEIISEIEGALKEE